MVRRKVRIKRKKSSKDKNDKTEPTDKKRKPRYPCLIYDEDHFKKECPHRAKVSKFIKGSPILVVLKDPFPTQDSNMVGSSSNPVEDIFMVVTWSQDYGCKNTDKEAETSNSSSTTSPSVSDPLQNKKKNPDLLIKPPTKGVLRKLAFNPHARAAQNYNIVEDLAISPSAMSALEVLQSCPA